MVRASAILLLVASGMALAACGGTARSRSAETASQPQPATQSYSTQRSSCPRGVLIDESTIAPVHEVLLAAQRLLSRREYGSQGTIYHLTPRNAPIDEVFSAATLGGPFDDTQPGLRAIHRVAALRCGRSTAQASWAIHYSIPVSVIASAGGWVFIVKTRTGWQFWGNWCGAGKSRQWRAYYC